MSPFIKPKCVCASERLFLVFLRALAEPVCFDSLNK
jgi:hypothetical protein